MENPNNASEKQLDSAKKLISDEKMNEIIKDALLRGDFETVRILDPKGDLFSDELFSDEALDVMLKNALLRGDFKTARIIENEKEKRKQEREKKAAENKSTKAEDLVKEKRSDLKEVLLNDKGVENLQNF